MMTSIDSHPDARRARGPLEAMALALAGAMAIASGCGRAPSGSPADDEPLSPADAEISQELNIELSDIINEESQRHEPLQYEYNEDLLVKLDQIESRLSGRPAEAEAGAESAEAPGRLLPKLSEQEEMEHLRETVRRWEAQTGRDLRETIDPLMAEVAARDPGEAFHPDFQRRFSRAFDSFIKIEVDEMRERRNRAIHERAEGLLDPYREEHPEVVLRIEGSLDEPPYNLPEDDSGPADDGGEGDAVSP